MRLLILSTLLVCTFSFDVFAQQRPPTQAENDRRDIQLSRCIDQVAQEIVRRNGAPMWAARQDALRWCQQNVR
jgi:hypothetical protein